MKTANRIQVINFDERLEFQIRLNINIAKIYYNGKGTLTILLPKKYPKPGQNNFHEIVYKIEEQT